MNHFRVTKERKVFLDDIEIQGILGFNVAINTLEDPEVVLRVRCESISIDGYTDFTNAKQRELHA